MSRKLLPEYLKEKGYATYALGKWHLGFCKPEYLPTNRGFDTHYGYMNGQEDYTTHDSYGYDFFDNGFVDFTANNTYSEHLFADKLSDIIDNHLIDTPEQPFFIYMAHQAVHTPLAPPDEYLDLYPDIQNEQRKMLFATASLMDDKVGQVVEKLKSTGLYDNTLIIWLSDNGGAPMGGGNNWPLRGMKGILYEGGIRTPGFIHAPPAMLTNSSGVISNHLMHITDWLPTLLHLAGASPEEIDAQNFSGQNRWPVLNNPGIADDPKTEIVHEINVWQNTTVGALRQGKYKLVKFYGAFDFPWFPAPEDLQDISDNTWNSQLGDERAADFKVRLFNIEEDPEEKNDLAETLPDVLDRMTARMEELVADMVPTQVRLSFTQLMPTIILIQKKIMKRVFQLLSGGNIS